MKKLNILLLSLILTPSLFGAEEQAASYPPEFLNKAEQFKADLERELTQHDQMLSDRREKRLNETDTYILYYDYYKGTSYPIEHISTPEHKRIGHINCLKHDKKRREALHALTAIEILLIFKNNCSLNPINHKTIKFGPACQYFDYSYRLNDMDTPKAFKAFDALQQEFPDCF